MKHPVEQVCWLVVGAAIEPSGFESCLRVHCCYLTKECRYGPDSITNPAGCVPERHRL
jgi:hypothetical protein